MSRQGQPQNSTTPEETEDQYLVSGNSDTNFTPGRVDELVKARAIRREAYSNARRSEAEKHKDAGNARFRAGEYRKAIAEYQAAARMHGPRPVYLSNMAAAWLKLKEWDAAEDCAHRALEHDPKFIKARYRRGLALKGNMQLAAATVDFRNILTQDPTSPEAKVALDETLAPMRARNEADGAGPSRTEQHAATPISDAKGVDLVSLPEPSDCRHVGSGRPCSRYNHGGCKRGVRCKFSHAANYRSVRDGLGRNVYLWFLLGACKFGDARCAYAHETTYLPSDGWWNDPETQYILRSTVRAIKKTAPPGWSTFALGKEVVPDELNAEMAESLVENWGFTEDEAQELLAQGVKPWEEDAWDVLNFLRLVE
ncbi:hypothetical protein BC834DRAFT_1042079 [Gloeopeniophorella convolvens]|nr:hypothetical protein BC834DRAFT_1042079 [Gloeopeniophorella convolvens]